MIVFALVVAGLITIAFPGASLFHPNAVSILMGSEPDDVACVESAAPSSSLEAARPSRTAQFSVLGSYSCRRLDFRLRERDSYVDLVIRAESAKAKRVASDLRGRLTGVPVRPIAVRASGDGDHQVRELVASIYRTELAGALGPGRVTTGRADPDAAASLEIELQRSDSADTVSRAVFVTRDAKGGERWQEL